MAVVGDHGSLGLVMLQEIRQSNFSPRFSYHHQRREGGGPGDAVAAPYDDGTDHNLTVLLTLGHLLVDRHCCCQSVIYSSGPPSSRPAPQQELQYVEESGYNAYQCSKVTEFAWRPFLLLGLETSIKVADQLRKLDHSDHQSGVQKPGIEKTRIAPSAAPRRDLKPPTARRFDRLVD
ncbi:hypothetical protein HU200_053136 [Digitaria exilis]|uniref:Uncharacterized protein n=1 Tax=Digitaria exilis TaxID=1010633 RepID=A0A835ARS5_9POAL|nr:hypothetical protein HU200_053136 [Digitaria exilis]